MFSLNLGHKWTLSDVDGLRGVVLLACGNPAPRMLRDHPGEFSSTLFDPQLYLAALEWKKRIKVCARLAAYPWFGIEGISDFDSSATTRKDWDAGMKKLIEEGAWPGKPPPDIERAAMAAVAFQDSRRCTAIILPAPLVEEREDEGGTLGEWVDAGIEAASELDVAVPLLATIAVSDRALNDSAFEPGGLLEAIVDQVAARKELEGVYIVVAQTGSRVHPFEMREQVVRAYLHLVSAFTDVGMKQIVVNFADLVGYVSVALGATRFVSGASASLRILLLDEFLDESGGLALPWFYSHRTATEYLSDTHLSVIMKKRLVRRVADETEASAPLMDALRGGQSASQVAAWVESRNNLSAAHRHYVQRLVACGAEVRKMRRLSDRLEHVVEWIESAEANALLVEKRVKPTVPFGRKVPLDRWRELVAQLANI